MLQDIQPPMCQSYCVSKYMHHHVSLKGTCHGAVACHVMTNYLSGTSSSRLLFVGAAGGTESEGTADGRKHEGEERRRVHDKSTSW